MTKTMKWEIVHSLYRTFQAESEVAIKKFKDGWISQLQLTQALKAADQRLTEELSNLRTT
jgi:hypothetical protein